MKQGEIQQILVATNRWWRNSHDWMRDDPDLREANEAPFRYSAGVLKGLAPGGLHVLRGPGGWASPWRLSTPLGV